MSGQEMQTKVQELRELRRMQDELAAEISAIEEAIKAEMTARDVEELTGPDYKVRWTAYTTSRFDTTKFKTEHADLYAAYTKATAARRFTIA